MSEPYPVGSWYISYFLSDQFDNIFKSWASPIKVAFTAGLGIGIGIGFGFGVGVFVFRRRTIKGANALKSGVQALPWNTGSLQLNGDFQEALEAILEKVSPFFENDDGLFSRLRERLDCQTEMTEGDFRSLMEVVAPGLMVDYRNSNLSVANFIYSVIEFLKNSKKVKNELDELGGEANGLTRRCFKADILLIHAKDDIELATEIEALIKSNDVSLKLDGDFGIGQPRFSRFENVFKEYIYVFILVTDGLKDDILSHFSGEMCLVGSLFNEKGRVIPVITTNEMQNCKYPVYNTITPWEYGTQRSGEQLVGLIQSASNTLFKIV